MSPLSSREHRARKASLVSRPKAGPEGVGVQDVGFRVWGVEVCGLEGGEVPKYGDESGFSDSLGCNVVKNSRVFDWAQRRIYSIGFYRGLLDLTGFVCVL